MVWIMRAKTYFGHFFIVGILVASSCSSPMPVKQQAYAKLSNVRQFDAELGEVWRAMKKVHENKKILKSEPKVSLDVRSPEFKRRTSVLLATDWIYGQSTDKYVEYQLRGAPQKKYLATRLKYELEAKSVMGGVEVKIDTEEEIEELKADGSSLGFRPVQELDTSRAAGLLDEIETAIRALPNI
jgi:hypothetical protein